MNNMLNLSNRRMTDLELKAHKDKIYGLEGKSPIALKLKELIMSLPNVAESAHIIGMLTVIGKVEKAMCSYCRAQGHGRNKCPVLARLRNTVRGDRVINKMRAKQSGKLHRETSRKIKVSSNKKFK